MNGEFTYSPADKKNYITELGSILIKHNGKKEFYKPDEVKKAHKESSWSSAERSPNFACWGMSIFSSHEDFDSYHQVIGENCNYCDLKQEMESCLTSKHHISASKINNEIDGYFRKFQY